MWHNYIRLTLRTLRKHKGFSAINVVGLAVSMAVCLIILLFLRGQHRYDRFHPHADRLYTVISDFTSPFGNDQWATTPASLASTLAANMPGVDAALTLRRGFGGPARYGDKVLAVSGLYAGASFFDLFGFELAAGNPATALAEPYSLVLSQELAEKFFGAEDPIGRVLTLQDDDAYTVTGLLKEHDVKSHLRFEALASLATLGDAAQSELREPWQESIYHSYTYLRLDEDVAPDQVTTLFPELIAATYPPDEDNELHGFRLLAVPDYNFAPDLSNKIGRRVPNEVYYVLSILALVIILSACFNYVSLTTARALSRAREVGIRKVVGAHRAQIVRQFLGEALLITFLALLLAGVLLPWLVPFFNNLEFMRAAEARLTIDFASDAGLYLILLGFSVGVGTLAGLYPALYLSSFAPANTLKGLGKVRGVSGLTLRKGLTVAQFALSLLFIIVTAVFYQQYRFILHADYGFDKAHIVNVELRNVPYDVFRNEVIRDLRIEQVSATSYLPATGDRGSVVVQAPGMDEPTRVAHYAIDYHFVDNLGLHIVAGRSLSSDFPTDAEQAILVNESFVRRLDLDALENAVGMTVLVGNDDPRPRTIVGIVQDYHAEPLTHAIAPVVLSYDPAAFNYANVRLTPGDRAGVLATLNQTWEKLEPGYPFTYTFYDAYLNERNADFEDLISVVGLTALLALFIASLGLLGMAAYSAETRVKEVGIRKVLGAGVGNIVVVLSKDFVKLVVLAAVVAVPLAYLLTNQWLQQFALRIDLSPWPFVLGVVATLAIAFLTISSQTFKAARLNPVESLKHE